MFAVLLLLSFYRTESNQSCTGCCSLVALFTSVSMLSDFTLRYGFVLFFSVNVTLFVRILLFNQRIQRYPRLLNLYHTISVYPLMPPKRKTPSTTSTTTGTSRPISSFFSRGGRTTSAPNPLFYKTDPLGWDAVKILNTSPSKHEKHEGGIINIYRDQEEQMNLQTICCVCGKDIGKGLVDIPQRHKEKY